MAEAYLNFELPIIPLCSHNHRGCSDIHKEKCKTPGKAPILKQWSKHATTTEDEVEGWFNSNRYINLGLVLGQTQDWNLVGVDIDGQLGETTFQELSRQQTVPDTWEYITGGGRRLLYMLPMGLKTKKNKVDWKEGHEELAFLAQGQQTVLPPSVHPSGKLYQWTDGHSPFDIDIADAPQWIIDIVQENLNKSVDNIENLPNFEQSRPVVLEENEQDLIEGNRSNGLTRLVGSLCAKRNLPMDTIVATTMNWNIQHVKPPLPESDVRAMVQSIWDSEMTKHQQMLARQRRRQELNPAALTELFVAKQANEGIFYKYFQDRGRLYQTNNINGPWTMCSDEQVKADIHTFLQEQDAALATMSKCLEILQQVQIWCTKEYGDGSDLDVGRHPNTKTIDTQNGVLEWETGNLLPWSKDFSHTIQFNAIWDPEAKKSKAYHVWDEALHSWLDQDETIMFLQEYIGYALLPTCKMRTAVFLHGEGANGKSLFLDIVQLLFQSCYHITQPKALASRFGTTAIVDKMLLVCSDIDSTYLDSTGALKQIIAGDEVRAEYKGGKEFNIKPVCKMLFSANKLPKSGDKSHGWYSRLQLVYFPHQFKADQKYYDKLVGTMCSDEGRSALLLWAVEGLKRLWKNGEFTISSDMDKNKKEYKEDNDNVLAFAGETLKPAIEPQGNYKTSLVLKSVYLIYKDYCEDRGVKVVSQAEFSARLTQIGYNKRSMRCNQSGQWKSYQCIVDTQFQEGVESDYSQSYLMYTNVMNK
jgi:P4 family phage/plasmid primase-like protien